MMEQIYNDFVTKMLPKVQEGLMITKDYFVDLFGRYVHYLIVIDIVWICFSIGVIIFLIYLIKKAIKVDDELGAMAVIFGSISCIVCVAFIMYNTSQLIKTIYIPEVRVYQELKTMYDTNSVR